METVLGIFCKQPIPGKVKTRLAVDIGDQSAARLYEAFLTDIVDRMRETADDRVLCYAPDDIGAETYFGGLSNRDYRLVPQVEGTLGDRLTAFFDEALRNGPRKVIVIGSDTPTITRARIMQASGLLDRWINVPGRNDAVLGRSVDGGYDLIGLRRMVRGIFAGIDWGTSSVYDQQERRLVDAGFIVRRLHPIPDIDTSDDLKRLKDHPLLKHCPHTYRVLTELDLL